MKKLLCILLAAALCLSLAACGKSAAIKDAESAIEEIGEVTLESADAIKDAEKLYGILTEAEKAKVDNRLALVEAREEYDELLKQVVYKNAKAAYEKLNRVAELCENGMDDIYGAWYFGIYEADDYNKYTLDALFYYEMAQATPNLSETDLRNGATKYSELAFLGVYDETSMAEHATKDWQFCLYIVEGAILEKGDYDTVKNEVKEAEKILQELTSKYDDYTYYPKLKDYYSAVSSYAEFFISPSGSFQQLSDTINGYETDIRTYKSDVGFLFSK